MLAEEMFKKENFKKLKESNYINGITYINLLGKEYEEISFLLNYEDSLNKEDEKTLICFKNIDNISEDLIYAMSKQLEEIKENR